MSWDTLSSSISFAADLVSPAMFGGKTTFEVLLFLDCEGIC